MKSSKVLYGVGLAGLLLALPLMGGCYVEEGPPPDTAAVVYEAPPPPPPPPPEVITVSPGPDYYWVGGYHRWSGRAYVWVPGHYERRPYRSARYYPGHWERYGRGHVWVEGRWR